jgi:hypothetical protein
VVTPAEAAAILLDDDSASAAWGMELTEAAAGCTT